MQQRCWCSRACVGELGVRRGSRSVEVLRCVLGCGLQWCRMLELYFVYIRVRVCFGIAYRFNSLLYKLILLYKEMPAGWG